ncbi:MAG TPA: type II secretion system F family protein [Pirellulaceae bacterium]|nr:type II secretion system F family protein [Pirellulaceae bacterium]
MTISATLARPPLTLEQLAALSDEIGALVRAGVPLDQGLREMARELPGRLGRFAGEMGKRIDAGQPLPQVVAELGSSLPPAYQTLIAAGLRAGRLPAALEGVARTARRISQLRRAIGLALIYPVVLLLLTWGLGLFVLTKLAPVFARMLDEFDVTRLPVGQWVDRAAESSWVWGPLVPALITVWLVVAWYRSGRVAYGYELHPLLAFGAVGTLARMQRAGRMASLAELLGLLLHHSVPLAEAVELATGACGSGNLARGGKQLAQQLRRGERIDEPPAGFSPLLAWTVASGQSQPQLCRTLARTAEVYREEFDRRGQWLTVYVPLALTVGLCGTVASVYAFVALGPWIAIMMRLAQPY